MLYVCVCACTRICIFKEFSRETGVRIRMRSRRAISSARYRGSERRLNQTRMRSSVQVTFARGALHLYWCILRGDWKQRKVESMEKSCLLRFICVRVLRRDFRFLRARGKVWSLKGRDPSRISASDSSQTEGYSRSSSLFLSHSLLSRSLSLLLMSALISKLYRFWRLKLRYSVSRAIPHFIKYHPSCCRVYVQTTQVGQSRWLAP